MDSPRVRLWPLGYHLTWHPYGTWLPGDERGWHRHGDGPAHRTRSDGLKAWCAERLRGRVVSFDPVAREIVERELRENCLRRGWILHALVVQSDHVHLVVSANAKAEAVVGYLKGWVTRALRAEMAFPREQPIWAEHASTRTLVTVARFENALRYVLGHHAAPNTET